MTRNLLVACNMLLAVAQAPPARGTLRLYTVGDINLGRRTARERLIAGDTLYSFRLLLDTLRNADITFGNLESPIAADTGQVDDSGAAFTAPPLAALALARAGFDIVSTANNHAWDGGEGTLQETMRQLTRAGVLFVGSGFGRDMAEQPVIVRRGGWRIAFFAITRAWNPAPYTFYRHAGANYVAWGDTGWIYPAIRDLKQTGRVDLVVVSVHGGKEFVDAPPRNSAGRRTTRQTAAPVGDPHPRRPPAHAGDWCSRRQCPPPARHSALHPRAPMTKPTLEFLKHLLDTPGPSGFETAPARVWREEVKAFADEVKADVHGNSVAALNPAGTPRLMLAGHIDEIGLQVTHVDDDGYLYFAGIGGWDSQVLVGQRVVIAGPKAPVRGVVGKQA